MVIYYSYKGTFIGLGKNWLLNLELVEVETGQIFDRFFKEDRSVSLCIENKNQLCFY